MNDITISTDKRKLNTPLIHSFLQQAYWSKGISFDTVTKGIKNSLCFGMFKDKEQIGFARVITDYTGFAYLADVFVIPKYRGEGLGKYLVKSIMEDPQLKDISTWMLKTEDAHSLYKQFGFEKPKDFDRIMQFKKK